MRGVASDIVAQVGVQSPVFGSGEELWNFVGRGRVFGGDLLVWYGRKRWSEMEMWWGTRLDASREHVRG